MKKLITILCLTFTTLFASAHCCYRYPYNWVAPAVVGGFIGYEISNTQQPVIVQQPVQSQVITDSNVVIINGVIYHKQYMNINGVLQEVLVK